MACLVGITITFASPRVVAPGNPPLTSEMVTKAASFYEWVLDVRFTPAQQQEYERMLARDWPDEGKRKTALDLLQNVDKLAAASEDTKQRVHQQVQNSLLESFRKETQDADARWMLAIYNAAHPGGSTSAPAAQTRYPAVEGKQLVGKWRATKGSAVQYANTATGALAPTNGSSFFYQFNADGTYQFNGLMQVTMYSCSTQLYNDAAGKYHVEGDRLFIEPISGKHQARQTCGANKYTEKPADLSKQEYIIHFEPNPNGAVLVINGTSGGTRPDYFRPER